MNELHLSEVEQFVNENIIRLFHDKKVEVISNIDLDTVIKKNPYLFKAKNTNTAQEIITEQLNAFLSSSEEELFGGFLEELAIFISSKTISGHKSTSEGVDLEFIRDRIHYVVAIKSGPNWGNSSQQKKLESDLRNAVSRLRQSNQTINVQPVLGICYGKTKTSYLRGYMKIVGQEFWNLISGNERLYIDIIEPIGYRANENNDNFIEQKCTKVNQLTREFLSRFCDSNGAIEWDELLFYVSGNLPKEKLPYGYFYTADGVRINENQKRIINIIIEIRNSEGQNSYNFIAQELNRTGEKKWAGNNWNSSNVKLIISHTDIYREGLEINDSRDFIPPI